jgi:hypothetical protein
MPDDPQEVLPSIMETILFHGVPENKLLCQGQVLRQNIILWQMLQQRLYGWNRCWQN